MNRWRDLPERMGRWPRMGWRLLFLMIMPTTANAIIIGFNVRPERTAAVLAEREHIDIRLHTVIYELVDEITKAMLGLLEPVVKETFMGRAEVLDTFRVSKVGTIAGCKVEEGKIGLADSAKKYVPAIGELRVLEGFDGAGQPKTRAPKRDITVNDLILHTSGLCYECFSSDDLKYREATGVPSVLTCTDASIKSVADLVTAATGSRDA